MSRINTNVPSVIARRILSGQNDRLTLSLQRLSTGLKINTGKDDPAGMIASERMRLQLTAIQAAQTNISRAINVVAVGESGLAEIARLINDLEDLVDRSSNETAISNEERDANQLEIDLILDSINRIANSTELEGRKLLSGTLAYTTSAVNIADIADLRISSARIPQGGSRTVNIDVLVAAELATLTYSSGTLASAQTIEVLGNLGAERITLASGATISSIADAVNMSTGLTGVSAVISAGNVVLTSTGYGSTQYVKVRALSGTQLQSGLDALEDFGTDVEVNVNGMNAIGDGLKVSVRTTALSADIVLTSSFGSQTATDTTFSITGGGANFMISPTLDLNARATVGIDAVTTASLGDRNVGFLYTLATGESNALNRSQYSTAQRIVRLAATQVGTLRGQLGSFERNTLQPNLNSLRIQYENVAAAESVLRDTDFAEETSNLTRAQILVQSATNVLRIANAAPNNVLALLGG